MPYTQKLSISMVSDTDIFQKAREVHSQGTSINSFAIDAPIIQVNYGARFALEDGREGLTYYENEARLVELLKMGFRFVQRFQFYCSGFKVQIIRSVVQEGDRYTRAGFLDAFEIEVDTPGNVNSLHAIHKFIEVFKAFDPKESVYAYLGEEIQKHYELRETSLERLESLQLRFTNELQSWAANSQQAILVKQDELQNEFNRRREQLESEYRRRSEELDARASKMDLQDNLAARRKTYDSMKQLLTKRSKSFEITSDTNTRYSRVIWSTCLLVLLLIGAAGFYGSTELAEVSKLKGGSEGFSVALVLVVARQLLFSFGVIVTFTFLIRTQLRWFQKHAEEEFRLKKLDLDIDRATWLVELAQEWSDDPGRTMPPELIDRLSRGLFQDSEVNNEDMHPIETLFSGVLGKSGKVQIKSMPVELNLERTNHLGAGGGKS